MQAEPKKEIINNRITLYNEQWQDSHTSKRNHVSIGKNKQTLIIIFSEASAHWYTSVKITKIKNKCMKVKRHYHHNNNIAYDADI